MARLKMDDNIMDSIKIGGRKCNLKDLDPKLRKRIEEQLKKDKEFENNDNEIKISDSRNTIEKTNKVKIGITDKDKIDITNKDKIGITDKDKIPILRKIFGYKSGIFDRRKKRIKR